jgi:hypothetical protein
MAVLWDRQKTREWFSAATLEKILRYAVVVLGGTLSIGAIISLWFRSPIPTACVGIIIGAGICWAAFSQSKLRDVAAAATRVAAITAITFSFVLLCYSDNLSNNRSSRRVLEEASRLVPSEAPLRVGFPFGIPFSSNFYAPLMTGRPVTVRLLPEDQIASADVDILIVRTKNTDKLRQFTQPGAQLGTVGKWSILKAR